ncbi:MAG: thiamine biosynthesis lipoprotein [bacterium]|nr:MAG: thiamine biosynthesis lipoprotein [bacterium]
MSKIDPNRPNFLLEALPQGKTGRRQFLAGLGLMAGASLLAPILKNLHLPRAESLEAGRPLLGTWCRIVARDADPQEAGRAVEAAFAAIADVDRQMSIHRPDSQLTAVNIAAGSGAAAVDKDVLKVVQLACDVARCTDGIYDPTILPLMKLYGFYDSGRRHFPTDAEVGRELARTGWRRVTIDHAAGTLGLAASDRAVAALRAHGIESGLVDVGGNVYGLGIPEPGAAGWSVGIAHPVTGRVDHLFVLRDSAVGTSGNGEQSRLLDLIRVGHLIDARRGRPSNGHLSASVQARSGVESDYLSTVAYLLGPDRFHGWPGTMASHFVG